MLKEFRNLHNLYFVPRENRAAVIASVNMKADKIIINDGIKLLDEMIKLTEIQEPSVIKEKYVESNRLL